MLNTVNVLIKNILNLKLAIILGFQNTRIFFLKDTPQIGQKKEVFVVSKIKNTIQWTYVINDLNGDPITGVFYKKELQKTSQEKFKGNEKGMQCISNGKGMIIHLIVGLIKNISNNFF